MANHTKIQYRKRRLKVILVVLMAFIGWTGYNSYQQWQIIKEKQLVYEQLKEKEAIALQTQKDLEKKAHLLNNKEYIAEMARKYYFMSKPGEIIIISPEG